MSFAAPGRWDQAAGQAPLVATDPAPGARRSRVWRYPRTEPLPDAAPTTCAGAATRPASRPPRRATRASARGEACACTTVAGHPALEVRGTGDDRRARPATVRSTARLRVRRRGRRRRARAARRLRPRRPGGLRPGHALAAPRASAGRGVSRRAAVVVLDACGVGELPDAAAYGDAGASTLAHLAEAAGGLDLPVLAAPRPRLDRPDRRAWRRPRRPSSTAAWRRWARARTRRPATGSSWAWSRRRRCRPTPTASRPRWSPRLEQATGLRFCCNRPANGVAVIERLRRAPPARRGEVILYTSRGLRAAARRARRRPGRGGAARGLRRARAA